MTMNTNFAQSSYPRVSDKQSAFPRAYRGAHRKLLFEASPWSEFGLLAFS